MKRKSGVVILFALCMLLTCACASGASVDELVSTDSALSWQEQYDLGVRYLSEGNYQDAIIAFTAAIEIDPYQVDTYIGLCDVYTSMGDIENAKTILIQGLKAVGTSDRLQEYLDQLIAYEDLDSELEDARTDETRQGNVITAKGYIIFNPDEYASEFAAYKAEYGEDTSIYTWNIRFSPPISVEIDGEMTTIDEAYAANVQEVFDEQTELRDWASNTNGNKMYHEMLFTGKITRGWDMDIMKNTNTWGGEYIYHPNQRFIFLITGYEEI